MIKGTCGKNLTWTLDDNGTLTISGTGEMDNYSWRKNYSSSWNDKRDLIKSVVIKYGVTTIGDNAFALCESLKNVTIPNSVTTIGDNAFGGVNR